MSNLPATTDDDFSTGLEEFGVEDTVIPRITIAHKDGQFKDSLTNEQFDTLTVIILGLVKQRVLWHMTVDDDDWPMCRSTNHITGFPNLSDEQPKEKRFPWDKSKFDKADFPPDEDGLIRLPCEGCALKEWGTHPDGKRPYCTEQFTLPILYDPRGDENFVPAVVTFQKTGLKPLKTYLSSFARSRGAAYEAVTEMSLDLQSRGDTVYSVPKFKRVGDTDQDDWRMFSANYKSIAQFLRAEPGSRDEDEAPTAVSDNTAKAPEQVAEKKSEPVEPEVVEEPKSEAPAAEADDDDDLPF